MLIEEEFIIVMSDLFREVVGPLLKNRPLNNNGCEWTTLTNFRHMMDLRINQIVSECVRDRLPSVGFLSEEGGNFDSANNYRIILDPIDGTIPWVTGISDHFGISAGLVFGKNPIAGVVYLPSSDKLYTVDDDYCHQELKTSNESDINRALVVIDPGKSNRNALSKTMFNFNNRVAYVFAFASSIASMIMVAEGRLHGFLHASPGPEDVAAAGLLVKASGGVVTALDGSEWYPECGSIVAAANQTLHSEFMKMVDI